MKFLSIAILLVLLQLNFSMENQQHKGEKVCSICLLKGFDDDVNTFLTKCGHTFHLDCINPWIATKQTCPNCRMVNPDPQSQRQLNVQLLWAASRGHDEFMQHIIKRGVNVNYAGFKHTALHAASSKGHESTVKLLLQHGANTKAQNVFGNTPIDYALTAKKDVVVKILGDHQKKLNNDFHFAALNHNFEEADRLIQAGADVNSPNRFIQALNIAAYNGDEKATEYLLANKANVNVTTRKDANECTFRPKTCGTARTPLMTAAAMGHTKVVKILINYKASPKLKDGKGKTARDVALNDKIKRLLWYHSFRFI